jgi:hypothetical protein
MSDRPDFEEMRREHEEAPRAPRPGDYPQSQDFVAPLGSATSGRLVFAQGISRVNLRGETSMDDLFRAHFEGAIPNVRVQGNNVTIQYPRYSPFDWLRYALYWGRQDGEVVLNGAIPWDIEVHGGASGIDANLDTLQLRSLDVGGGVSSINLLLARPSGIVPIRIHGGASKLSLRRPQGVAVRVHVRGGVSALALDDQFFGAVGGETRWESPEYKQATDAYDIIVSGGASNLSITAR